MYYNNHTHVTYTHDHETHTQHDGRWQHAGRSVNEVEASDGAAPAKRGVLPFSQGVGSTGQHGVTRTAPRLWSRGGFGGEMEAYV